MILFKDKIIKLYIFSISILLSSVIIGYDGYDKAYSSDLSLLEDLYQIIDKMPVRQNEMLNGVSSCD